MRASSRDLPRLDGNGLMENLRHTAELKKMEKTPPPFKSCSSKCVPQHEPLTEQDMAQPSQLSGYLRNHYFPVEFWPASKEGNYTPAQLPAVTWINICICLYNEPAHLLDLTLTHLANEFRSLSSSNGMQARVLIIADGWEKCSADTKDYLKALFSDSKEDSRELWWHQLESVAPLSISSPSTLLIQKEVGKWSYSGLHLSLVFKADNRGKVNSHAWFFNAFCKRYTSSYLLLTDCGTHLGEGCIYELVKHMEAKKELSAVTGSGKFMSDKDQQDSSEHSVFYPLYRAWQILDYEGQALTQMGAFALMGFMPVLPGPLQMLRASCLDEGVTQEYLRWATLQQSTEGFRALTDANVKLTEDRILAFALVFANKLRACKTGFVPSAEFFVDTQTATVPLLIQRRRWANGTLSALALLNFHFSDSLWRHHSLSTKYKFGVHFLFLTELTITVLPLISPIVLCGFVYHALADGTASAARWMTAIYLLTYLQFMIIHYRVRFHSISYRIFMLVSAFVVGFIIATSVTESVARRRAEASWGVVSALEVGFLFILLSPIFSAIIYKRYRDVPRLLANLPFGYLYSSLSLVAWSQYNVVRMHDCSWGTRPSAAQLRKEIHSSSQSYGDENDPSCDHPDFMDTDSQTDYSSDYSESSDVRPDLTIQKADSASRGLRQRHPNIDKPWSLQEQKQDLQAKEQQKKLGLLSMISDWIVKRIVDAFVFLSGENDFVQVDGRVDAQYQTILQRRGAIFALWLVGANVGAISMLWILDAAVGRSYTIGITQIFLVGIVTYTMLVTLIKLAMNFYFAMKWSRSHENLNLGVSDPRASRASGRAERIEFTSRREKVRV